MKKTLFLLLETILFFGSVLFAVEPVKQEDSNNNIFRITSRSGAQHLELSNDWRFGWMDTMPSSSDELETIKKWWTMKSPMTVQNALFFAGEFPDPYKGMNSGLYDWIHEKKWCFTKSFTLSPEKKKGYVFLSFEGVDYYSSVWLNGKKLGIHEGMFGGPEFEISSLLKDDGPNTIVVAVDSAKKRQPNISGFKMGYAVKPWGTAAGDNAKPFFSFGIWRGVRIDSVPRVHLERPYLVTQKVSVDQADLHLETEILVDKHSLEISLYPPKNRQLIDLSSGGEERSKQEGIYKIRSVFIKGNTEIVREFPIDLYSGRNWFRTNLTIDKPALWYPNQLGDQPIYDVKIELLKNGNIIDTIAFPFGIRTIQWTETPGPKMADRWGDWQCIVNGKKFFVKGVNWMPIDSLFDLPAEKYRWYLKMAKDAGIQILRIWGPGLQEAEEFYDACDQYGLMVWQDFPIGNAEVSTWNTLVWESQTMHTIFRLRNRTSLAVWCGGNEFNPFCPGNTPYTGIIERNLNIFDPSRKFVRTSPDEGSFHCYPDMDPTWYKKRFKNYPALAESGIHSVSSERSLGNGLINDEEFKHVDKMYLEEYRKLCPESIHHFVEYYPQRIPRMLSRASHYVSLRDLTLQDMAMGTQLGAGEFYQLFSEGMLGNYPVTAVQMPWVFARSWPVISGVQLVDGTGLPVAPYYFLKRTYEPIHVVFDLERVLWKAGEQFPSAVKILNLSNAPAGNALLALRIYDDQFHTLHEWTKSVLWKSAPSVEFVKLDDWTIPTDYKNRFFFVVVELKQGDHIVSRSVYNPRTVQKMEEEEFYKTYISKPCNWPTNEKGPHLKTVLKNAPKSKPVCEIISQTERIDGRYRITEYLLKISNQGQVPSPVTWFELSAIKPLFYAGDNFFWLAANEERTVTFTVRENKDDKPIQYSIQIQSWNGEGEGK